jgi:hypothetical protein
LRIAGVRESVDRDSQAQRDRLIHQIVVPHLQQAPDDGALIVVDIRTTDMFLDATPYTRVIGAHVSFGTSQAQAYIRDLATPTVSTPMTPGIDTQQQWMWWYRNGTIERYDPKIDPALQPAPP